MRELNVHKHALLREPRAFVIPLPPTFITLLQSHIIPTVHRDIVGLTSSTLLCFASSLNSDKAGRDKRPWVPFNNKRGIKKWFGVCAIIVKNQNQGTTKVSWSNVIIGFILCNSTRVISKPHTNAAGFPGKVGSVINITGSITVRVIYKMPAMYPYPALRFPSLTKSAPKQLMGVRLQGSCGTMRLILPTWVLSSTNWLEQPIAKLPEVWNKHMLALIIINQRKPMKNNDEYT